MAVREGLLALLSKGPTHGYQLKASFEAATGGVWPLNVGQVYTTLDRLERDGLVGATEPSPARSGGAAGASRVYELTASGREALGEWWQAVPVEDPPPRDELMLKVLMATERGAQHALDVITRHRSALLALLAERRRAERARRGAAAAAAGGERLAAAMVADALVVRAEADLRWLDLCEARLAGGKEAS